MATSSLYHLLAEDPARLADFYHAFLGTEELGGPPKVIFKSPMAFTSDPLQKASGTGAS